MSAPRRCDGCGITTTARLWPHLRAPGWWDYLCERCKGRAIALADLPRAAAGPSTPGDPDA